MKDKLLDALLSCGIFKVGDFKLKSGSYSPIYIDLRQIISYPNVLKDLAIAIRDLQMQENVKADVICGVPYTALPLASVFSVNNNIKMVMKRKEQKDHGTKKMIEGNIIAGDTCLIIEDIVSSGSSVIETADALRLQGLKVEDCIVVVNRNQGGLEYLRRVGIKLHCLFDINEIFQAYCKINRVETELVEQVNTYFKYNRYLPVNSSVLTKTYSERASTCSHPVGKKLLALMERKKTNLCVAVDTASSLELLDLAERLGPFICILKTHIDILEDFSESLVTRLKDLSKHHNFLIMEDRKFADIGNTAERQFSGGLYKIQSWADIVTVHAISGDGIIKALKDEQCALVLVAEMSSKGNLTTDEYKAQVLQMAESNADSVIGYVAQRSHSKTSMIHMCPGVSMSSTGDAFGQQYKLPGQAIADGADIIIVGRGISRCGDSAERVAEQYRKQAFKAYLRRTS